MNEDQRVVTSSSLQKVVSAIELVEASLKGLDRFNSNKEYTPKELEPYDALSDRFIRAVESALKFFRSYEKLQFAENSETLRDLLLRMEKLHLVESMTMWMEMRDMRNRIVHDYLPEQIKELHDLTMGKFGRELLLLKNRVLNLDF